MTTSQSDLGKSLSLQGSKGNEMLHIVWRFRASAEQREQFLQQYSSDGAWTDLFRKSPDYHGTSMLQDIAEPLGFLVVDRWSSNQAVPQFCEEFGAEYEELDRHCQRLTQEHLVGIYKG